MMKDKNGEPALNFVAKKYKDLYDVPNFELEFAEVYKARKFQITEVQGTANEFFKLFNINKGKAQGLINQLQVLYI